MRNAIIIMCGVGVVSACSPAPICDDDIYINKWETPIDECRGVSNPVRHYRDSDNDRHVVVEKPKEDKHKEEDKHKVKRDNSDANGKGGNKHDREDHTKNGTETAENKK